MPKLNRALRARENKSRLRGPGLSAIPTTFAAAPPPNGTRDDDLRPEIVAFFDWVRAGYGTWYGVIDEDRSPPAF